MTFYTFVDLKMKVITIIYRTYVSKNRVEILQQTKKKKQQHDSLFWCGMLWQWLAGQGNDKNYKLASLYIPHTLITTAYSLSFSFSVARGIKQP